MREIGALAGLQEFTQAFDALVCGATQYMGEKQNECSRHKKARTRRAS
jgi:hypothetical protein